MKKGKSRKGSKSNKSKTRNVIILVVVVLVVLFVAYVFSNSNQKSDDARDDGLSSLFSLLLSGSSETQEGCQEDYDNCEDSTIECSQKCFLDFDICSQGCAENFIDPVKIDLCYQDECGDVQVCNDGCYSGIDCVGELNTCLEDVIVEEVVDDYEIADLFNEDLGLDCDDPNNVDNEFCAGLDKNKVKADRCCLCQYMERAECNDIKSEKECKDKLINFALDCNWFGGKCISKFKNECNEWSTADKQKSCDINIITTYDKYTGDVLDKEKYECTRTDYKYKGHGRSCEDAAIALKGCFECTTKTLCVDEFSCSTFENKEELHKRAEEIRKRLEELKSEAIVTWTGQQDVATLDCRSDQTLVITAKSVGTYFINCEDLGAEYDYLGSNICPIELGKATCLDTTSFDGRNKNMMCCPQIKKTPNGDFPYSKWMEVDPDTEVCKNLKVVKQGVCVESTKYPDEAPKSEVEEAALRKSIEDITWRKIGKCLVKEKEEVCDKLDNSYFRSEENAVSGWSNNEYKVEQGYSCYQKK